MTKQAEFLPNPDETVVYSVADMPEEHKTGYERKLEELLDSVEDDDIAEIRLYRQRGDSIKAGLTFLDSMPADKMPFHEIQKFLRDTYGGGDYRLQMRIKGRLKMNELISIETPKKDVPHKDNELSPVIERMMDRMERLEERLMYPQHKTDPEEAEEKMLRKMMLYKQIFSNDNNQSGGGVSEMLSIINGLKDAGLVSTEKDVTPKEDNDSFMGFLTSMADPLKSVIESSMNQRAHQAQQAQQRPTEQPKPEPIPQQPKSDVNAMISMALSTLINAAKNDSNPEIYADLVIDQLPEEHLPGFLEMLESEQWFDNLKLMSQDRVIPHQAWFARLRGSIIGQFDDEPPINDDPERDGRDNSDG